MTTSRTTRTLVGSTALAALLAMPLMAQEAPATSETPEAPSTQAAPDTAPDMTSEEAAAASMEAVESGTAVAVTSDDMVIGKIENMTPLDDGLNRYEITLDGEYDVAGGRVAIQSPDQLNADGELELAVTQQEFAAAVQQQLGGSETDTETQTN